LRYATPVSNTLPQAANEVDELLDPLADLQRAAAGAAPLAWSEILKLAARVFAGAPLWWLHREREAWGCVASSLGTPAPEAASRLEEEPWALVVGAPAVDPALLRNVLYALVLRARNDEVRQLKNEAVEAYAALRDLGFEGICISREGVLVEVNQAFADLYGYTREELLGMHMSKTIAPEVLPIVVELVRSGYEEAYETAALRKDGVIIPLEARGKEIMFQGLPARVAAFRDLRASKAAAAELEAARRVAERESQQKTVFLGNISHELRTPMNAVLGVAQLLRQEPLEPQAHGLAQQLHTSASDMVDLLDDLLDITRIEEGRLELRERPFQIRSMIERVLRSLRSVHGGVQLIVTIDDEVGDWWRGDDRRIRQVLLNLLDNAVKFTPQGRVDAQVSRRDGEVSFTVRDTGIGIPEHVLPLLFQRFERGGAIEDDAYSGSGLGLHISQELAARMGGTLTAHSEKGLGSTFVLALPLIPLREVPAPRSSPEVEDTAPLAILVAEDDPVSQIVIRRLLQSLGHTVTVVPSGVEVLPALQTDPYDLVLMDVQMPVLGGLEATRLLREAGHRLPVVALTAHAQHAHLERCLEVGMDAWLTKPVELPRLQATLTQVLLRPKREGSRSAAASTSRDLGGEG
jgi:PAS domain S-box-containing protein